MADHMCFGCSPHNPIGLKMKFFQHGDIVYTTFKADVEHQGYNGYMHGGLISTLLDETMAQWLWIRNIPCMTAEMTVRYSEGVPIGRELRVESRCVDQRRDRLFEIEGKIILPGGNVAVRSTAKFLRIDISEIQKNKKTIGQD
ncbi:MAG: PaaI family thioesterase [Firmicutes bacterium]|nr:PaaI family thioesterase [Bacillota bacterium]